MANLRVLPGTSPPRLEDCKAQEASLRVKGAKLFNLLPQELRNLDKVTVDTFKSNLDSWLEGVADQPTIPGRELQSQTL